MGFQFNCLPYYESNRSWEDHYEVLLKLKERNNGSARLPLKYKADLRLGKWVQSQGAVPELEVNCSDWWQR